MIKFACPSGHPLSAPENMAGRPGKCPKCNAPFVIPAAEAAEVAAATTTEPGDSGSHVVTAAMASGKDLAGGGELFVFLCPNGHKLNGPASLKGKPGQCPHCHARFIIPTDEDIPEEEEPPEEEEYQPGEEYIEEDLEPAPDRGGIDFDRLFAGEERRKHEGRFPRPPAGAAALGFIVGRLWEQRTDDTELEVFLSEGEILAPDFYSELLSTSDFGVFGVQEGDGSFAITVIPWSAVRRVGMRRITKLPGELFQ